MRRVSWSDPWHPALLVGDQRREPHQDVPVPRARNTKQGEEMTTTEHTALSALRARLYVLERTLRKTTIERDRHQRMVDTYQRQIEEAVAETNSINAAIELLDAATEYAGEQA